jgi:DNA-binding transcriptional regulator YiaG
MSSSAMTWNSEPGTSLGSALSRLLKAPSASIVQPTGGTATIERRAAATGSYDVVVEETMPLELSQRPADLISQIRAWLSLNISELASVLHVERPTIYAWIAGSAVPQAANMRRLIDIASWAREWSRLSKVPMGSAVRQQGLGGITLVDLLADEDGGPVGVRSFLGALVSAQHATMTEPSLRGLRARGVPFVENARGYTEFDRVTRRRLAPEE